MEWRQTTKLVNNSNLVSTTTTVIGFTSIKAPKGAFDKAYYYDVGETQKILDSVGYPSATYPAIQDAINFNKAYPLYIATPVDSASALHGGVLVTKEGTKSLASGLDNAEITDFSAIEQEEVIGTGDGTTATFNFTTQLFDYYKAQSIDILVDGVSQTVTATDDDPEELSTAGGDSGTFDTSTGTLAYTFATAPAEGEVIKVKYTIDVASTCYWALLSKGGQADDLVVIVSSLGSGSYNLELYRRDVDDDTVYNATEYSPYEVSTIEGSKDGFGQATYLETVFDEDTEQYVVPVINEALAFDTFVDDTTYVPFAGGVRGDDPAPSDIVEGFAFLEDADEYDDVAIVFDTTAEGAVVSEFETLRGTDASPGARGRTKFLVPVAMQAVSITVGDTATAKNNVENRGINFFGNPWCKHKDLYNDKPFICSGMGQIAKRYGDSKYVSNGALSPMYIDENGVGGQLGSNVISLVNTANETQLKAMNSAGINGIKKISGSGFTIVGDRTSVSSTLSDMSYSIHSDLTDYILKSIEEQVLPQQISKPNDNLHRNNVASKAELIMSSVANHLEDYYVLCDLTNNTDAIRNQRKFVLGISVIFTPNSQEVQLVFLNSSIGTDVTQVLTKS